jgi:hypothetical protein
MGIEGTKAKFIGVYRTSGRAQRDEPGFIEPPTGYLTTSNPRFQYKLVRHWRFDLFRDRLIIEWGRSTLSWHQWLDQKDKEIVEIRPPGFVKDFTEYLDFPLTFAELEDIVNHSSANSVWCDTLGAVGGVYLILDTRSGNQYVGSASGSLGLFGRWSDYVCVGGYGHRGNEKLKPIATEGRPHDLQFTVLNILPLAYRKAILAHETRWKEKLGTRVFGLNPN